MAKFSYVIFLVSVGVRGRPHHPVPVDNVDGNGMDLFAAIKSELEKKRGVVVEDDRAERAHRVERFSMDGRTILIEGKVGPYGSFGTSVDLDTGDERDFSDRTANMLPLRAMVAVPDEGYEALLICERAGASMFRNPIEKSIFRQINSDLSITIKTQAYVDAEAWDRFLDEADIRQVTAVYRSRRLEDIGPQRGRAQDLKIVAGGMVARRLGRRLSTLITYLARRDTPVTYSLDDYPELRPGDRDNYEQDHLEVQVADGNEQRTIVVRQAELPQFHYPLTGRVPTRTLWDAWKEHARKVLSDLGASMNS